MKALLSIVLLGAIGIGGFFLYSSMTSDEEADEDNDDDTTTQESSLDNYMAYPNQSLYPGLGGSDLRKPDGFQNTRGVENCATWCNDNADCKAFHHWVKNPDNLTDTEIPVEDLCFYWSTNMNEDQENLNFTDALGPGDEGKGEGYQVDAYIKKGMNAITQASSAEGYTGTVTHHNPFVNSLVNYMVW